MRLFYPADLGVDLSRMNTIRRHFTAFARVLTIWVITSLIGDVGILQPSSANAQSQDLASHRSSLMARRIQINSAIEQKSAQLAAQLSEARALEIKLTSYQQEERDIKADAIALQSKVPALEAAISRAEIITEACSNSDAWKTENCNLIGQQGSAEWVKAKSTIEQLIRKLNADGKKMADDIQSLDARDKRVRAQIAEASRSAVRLSKSVPQLKSEISDLKSEIVVVDTQLAKVDADALQEATRLQNSSTSPAATPPTSQTAGTLAPPPAPQALGTEADRAANSRPLAFRPLASPSPTPWKISFEAKSFIARMGPETNARTTPPSDATKAALGFEDLNSTRSQALALLYATDDGFSENPQSPSPNSADFRLWSRVELKGRCAGLNNFETLEASPMTIRAGPEGPLDTVGAELVVPAITRNSDGSATVVWAMKGRPNRLSIPAFHSVRPRSCEWIWHHVSVRISCSAAGQIPNINSLDLKGSRFPSHRLWVNGLQIRQVSQGPFERLWICSTRDPALVD